MPVEDPPEALAPVLNLELDGCFADVAAIIREWVAAVTQSGVEVDITAATCDLLIVISVCLPCKMKATCVGICKMIVNFQVQRRYMPMDLQ